MVSAADILNRLSHLHPKAIDLSLDRLQRLLRDLGSPQDRLPPVIHIAGTNGKGSTLAFIRAFMEEAGFSVHMYSSPHLVRFNERISLNGRDIDDSRLISYLERVEKINAGRPITFFEATTAAAFLAFSETPADVLLLETGMGGRLDATNVVERPALTLIASLSMDHEDFLGHTLAAIAGEKAAVFKTGATALAAQARPEAEKVLRETAKQKNVRLKIEGTDWNVQKTAGGFLFDGTLFPAPGLPGVHQYQNAGLAVAAVRELRAEGRFAVSDAAIAAGLASVRWPGRLERLTDVPLPSEWELWADGGHNPGAGEMLARFLPEWSDKPLHLVCGMLTTKDADSFLRCLAPFAASFHAVPVPEAAHPSYAPDVLAGKASKAGIGRVKTAGNIGQALENLTSGQYPSGRILICGSLYLLGSFLSLIRGTHDNKQ